VVEHAAPSDIAISGLFGGLGVGQELAHNRAPSLRGPPEPVDVAAARDYGRWGAPAEGEEIDGGS
jgi:hypothetical protein